MTETVCFLTRHTITDAQRHDFMGWRQFQVKYRAESASRLWLEVVLEAGGAPTVIVATLPWHWQRYFVKHVQKMAPNTLVVRAMTEEDNLTLTGRYLRYRHVYGKGLVFEEYLPPRIQRLNGLKAE